MYLWLKIRWPREYQIKARIGKALQNKWCNDHQQCLNDKCKQCMENSKHTCRKLAVLIEIAKDHCKYLRQFTNEQESKSNTNTTEKKYDDNDELKYNLDELNTVNTDSSSSTRSSSSSSYSNLDTRDRTIYGIGVYKNGLIDIFNIIDCKWYKAKIIDFIKEDETIICKLLFDQTQQAIHYGKQWWRVAKYASKSAQNNGEVFSDKNRSRLIAGILSIKSNLKNDYIQKYVEITFPNKCIYCYDNRNKNKCKWKIYSNEIKMISENKDDPLSFTLDISTLKANNDNDNNDTKTMYFKCSSLHDFINWMCVVRYVHKYNTEEDKIYDGIIYKKGQHLSASYKRRYFVLRHDGNLYYCDIDDKLKPQNHKKIDLNDTDRITISDDEKYYLFNIVQPNRTWELSVKTKTARKKWVKLIKQQCAKWKRKVVICVV